MAGALELAAIVFLPWLLGACTLAGHAWKLIARGARRIRQHRQHRIPAHLYRRRIASAAVRAGHR